MSEYVELWDRVGACGAKGNLMPTKGDLLEAVMACVPYASQIKDIELDGEVNTIRFTWRGDRFRVSENLVETVEGSLLCSGNLAILMESCVKRGLMAIYERRSREVPDAD